MISAGHLENEVTVDTRARHVMQPGDTILPLRFTRGELISPDQAGRVHALARRILHEIGMEVRHAGALERLQAEGLCTQGNRVFFEPALVDRYVDDMRRWIASRPASPAAPDDGRLTLSVSSYSLHVHDIETDRVVPYTTDRLVEMCKLMDTLADDGVYGTPPGIPIEEPPDLQPIAQYRIAALYARQGASPVDPTSARTVNYVLDMAEVMGRPIHSLPVLSSTTASVMLKPLLRQDLRSPLTKTAAFMVWF